MLKTLQSRIFTVTALSVFFTVFGIVFFVQTETIGTLAKLQDEHARNLMNTVLLNVENQYNSLIFHRKNALEIRKAERKYIVTIVITVIDQFYQRYRTGLLTETEAQKQALATIKKMRYDEDVGYFWINDTKRPIPRMIMHAAIPELDGKLLDDPKYNVISEDEHNFFKTFVDIGLRDGEGYLNYPWPKPSQNGLSEDQMKISYARLYDKWQWIVGTGIYIEDIEKDAIKRRKAIVKELQQTFSKVRLAETGYMFIFDGNKNILIHPELAGTNGSQLVNPASGNSIFEELIHASKTPDKPFEIGDIGLLFK